MRPPRSFLLVLVLALAACPNRLVTVSGQDKPAEATDVDGMREVERTRAEVRSLKPAEAAERFESLSLTLGPVPSAAEALYEAGLRWRSAARPDRAQAAFGRLLTLWPLSPRAPEAKYQLALSEGEGGRPKDALAGIQSLYDKLPPEERLEASRAAARAAEESHNWPQAARWRAESSRLAQGPERDRELVLAVEHLDARLTFPEVVQLAQDLPQDSPLLPAATLKVARVELHLHDEAAAERSAREVVERWPNSPQAQDARALAERLAHRAQVDPKVIGVAVPLSGKQKAWGEAILEGVSLALGEGSSFRLAVKDTKGEPDGAQEAVQELALAEGAVAALGGVVNAEATRAATAAEEAGLPFLSLSRAEGVTQAGPFIFRNMLTAQAQAQALVDLALVRRGLRRFALLYPEIPYGQELANAFWDELDLHGGEVRAAESYEHDRTTFAPLVKSMVGKLWLEERPDYVDAARDVVKDEKDPYRRKKALERLKERLPPIADFDALFLPDFAKNVALIAPALAVEDIVTETCDQAELERIRKATGREDLQPVQLLGANGWDDPSLVEKAGRYVECAIFVDGFYPASERPATKAFVTAFQARYGHAPSILEASAYDAALIIRHALEAGATTREAVRDQIAGIKAFPGATGDLAFDARREVAKTLFYLTIEKGVVREMTAQELSPTGPG